MQKAPNIREVIKIEFNKLMRTHVETLTINKTVPINNSFTEDSAAPVENATIDETLTGVLKQTDGLIEGGATFGDVGAEEAGHIATIPVTITDPQINDVLKFNSTSTIVNDNVPSDNKVKVSNGDQVADYLDSKLVQGTNITIVKNNAGATETLTINAAGSTGGVDEKVKISATDTVEDYLLNKLVEGENITLTKTGTGTTETITIAATGSTGGTSTVDEQGAFTFEIDLVNK